MRVLEKSDDRLVIEEQPWFWGLFFVVFILAFVAGAIRSALDGDFWLTAMAVLVVIGVGALAAHSIERVWLVFDRRAGTVELRRRSLRGFRREVFPLSELAADGVFVQRSEDTQRIALHLASRDTPVPVTNYYQSGGRVRHCAEIAARWLTSS